ncbi:MAG: hypothetical protein QOJ58_5559, partial [Alphaproteobacteria bacterium]|nr:hypothetical protein [Alphaproteobacteria bacterium]
MATHYPTALTHREAVARSVLPPITPRFLMGIFASAVVSFLLQHPPGVPITTRLREGSLCHE